jgi:hypothetical protein
MADAARLFPASKDAVETEDTPEGVIVTMTTEPRPVQRPDGFMETTYATRWHRGPMHRDDAAALVRILREHGSEQRRWTPVLPPRGEVSAEDVKASAQPNGQYGFLL